MKASTTAEFNPNYFKTIFGEDASDWNEFIQVNLKTYRSGCLRLKTAIEHGDMDAIKEIRHTLGPTLQQWNALTLEQSLIALDAKNIATDWPPLEVEFEALIAALENL